LQFPQDAKRDRVFSVAVAEAKYFQSQISQKLSLIFSKIAGEAPIFKVKSDGTSPAKISEIVMGNG
jgi:hypothetical protein